MNTMTSKTEGAGGAIEGKSSTVDDLEAVGLTELARYLEVDLALPLKEQIQRCKEDVGAAIRMNVKIGLRLLAIKQAAGHGEFEDAVAALGCSYGTRNRCMTLARAYASAGAEKARLMLGMSQAKALTFLGEAEEVQQVIVDNPELQAEILQATNAQMKARLKKLQADLDLKTRQLDTAEQTALADTDKIVVAGIPAVILDIRREVASLAEKARVSLADLADLAGPLTTAGHGELAADWVDPTALQVLVAMRSIHAQLGMQLKAWVERFDLDPAEPLPTAEHLAYYQPDEIVMVARQYQALLNTHADEAEKRANRAHNERARGRKRSNV